MSKGCILDVAKKGEIIVVIEAVIYINTNTLRSVMKQKGIYFLLLLCFCFLENTTLKANEPNIKISLLPDHADWIYKIGEEVKFCLTIEDKTESKEPYSIVYEIGPEKMKAHIIDSLVITDTSFSLDGGSMKTPGFLRCKLTVRKGSEKYTSVATAAFEPEKINPTVKRPTDFEQYWTRIIEKTRAIPLDLQLTLLEEKCNETTSFYHISYQDNAYKSRFYGILTVPKKSGKYPAVIRFPGAGVVPLGGNALIAGKEVIALDLYIHPFPANLQREFYDTLAKNSSYMNYMFWGVRNRDTYYYNRVISGCVKAVDVIYTLPQFDGQNLAAWGSSQGGALSIITTALDKRVKMLVALCPAMCDFTGYYHGRAGGWPHFFSQSNLKKYDDEEVVKVLSYYDVVNFAEMITVPGYFSWGFNDETTPPTSFYSAFNVIKASKRLLVIPEGEHKIYPQQTDVTYSWIFEQFN